MRPIVPLVYFILTFVSIANADSLEKRHQLGLNIGMWCPDVTTEASTGSVSTSLGNNGFLGGVNYGYSLTESMTLGISAGVMLTKMETKVGLMDVSNEYSSITQILINMKIYFPKSTYGSSVRPFVRVGAGPYIGNQEGTKVNNEVIVESRSETAFGGQGGLGVDFILGQHFLADILIGYNLTTDFNNPIGGSKNCNGLEFSFGFRYLFGNGRAETQR